MSQNYQAHFGSQLQRKHRSHLLCKVSGKIQMEGNKDLEEMKEKPGEVPLFISSLVVNVQPKLQKGASVTPHLSEVFGFLTFSHTSERE